MFRAQCSKFLIRSKNGTLISMYLNPPPKILGVTQSGPGGGGL